MNNTPNASHCDAHHGGYFSTALADGGFNRLLRVIFLLPRSPLGRVFLRKGFGH